MNTICSYLRVFVFVGFMATLGQALKGFCPDRDPSNRIECGWPGITQEDCEARGCCFDSRFPKSLWCFKKDEHSQDADFTEVEIEGSIVRSCEVNPWDRVDCGWPSIKKEVCENRGCCYSEDVRRAYWCFRPKTIFTQPVVQAVMECVAECANLSWRKTIRLGAACDASVTCWFTKEGIMGATCMSACKTNTSILDFIGNVSSCLGLTPEEQYQTSERCEFDVSCWVQRHGIKASSCFRDFSKLLEMSVETVGDYGQVARHPNPAIQMPRLPPRPPMEPQRSGGSYGIPQETIATDPDVERSRIHPVEDLTDEEEPNPWWEPPVRA